MVISLILKDPLTLIAQTITWQQAPDHWMRGFHAMHRPYASHPELSTSHA
jgi:hypothetical protein